MVDEIKICLTINLCQYIFTNETDGTVKVSFVLAFNFAKTKRPYTEWRV